VRNLQLRRRREVVTIAERSLVAGAPRDARGALLWMTDGKAFLAMKKGANGNLQDRRGPGTAGT